MSARDIRSIVGELLARADLLEEENARLREANAFLQREVGRMEDMIFEMRSPVPAEGAAE